MSEIFRQWQRVESWLQRHAPRSATPRPASDVRSDLSDGEDLLGGPMPAELAEWFALVGGWRDVLPHYEMVSPAMSLDIRDEMQELMADQYGAAYFDKEARSVALGETEPAGREARMFLPSFIPIASQNENYLFVDTRQGDLSGCVTAWEYSTADQAGPIWPNLATKLDELATALETGSPFLDARAQSFDDRLVWR